MRIGVMILCLMLPFQASLAFCDITRFRWECDLLAVEKPNPDKYSLVYCNQSPLYVNQAQYEIIRRYQRSDINMVLRINDEFITGPCYPAGRYGFNSGAS